MKSEREILKDVIHNYPDQFIIEKCNEINRYENGVSEYVYNIAKNVHGDKDFVIKCIFDEYDQRKKRLNFVALIFCNWVNNLIKMK